MNLADGSFWIYECDALGQVKSDKRYWNDWTPVAGQQFGYGFDDRVASRGSACVQLPGAKSRKSGAIV